MNVRIKGKFVYVLVLNFCLFVVIDNSIYGLRVLYGESMTEREVNIHFKYIDNTLYDIIQHCVFVIKHDIHNTNENEKDEENCDSIETICNTFLPITPRPLLKRDNLIVCQGEAFIANNTLTETTTAKYTDDDFDQEDSSTIDTTFLEMETEQHSDNDNLKMYHFNVDNTDKQKDERV